MAVLDVLFAGYVGSRVAGTVSLVRTDDVVAVIDPGMVPDRSAILDPLAQHGVVVGEVTDVVISHHHPDHTINMALFPNARVHDHWAIYHRDVWESRAAEGFALGPGVTLLETPGHTPQDITTLVETDAGVVALTHLWWHSTAESDPLADDVDLLHQHRARVLERAVRIVPGHGEPFEVTAATPR